MMIKVSPVLIASPVMPTIIEQVAAKFPVVKLYEQADPQAFLAEHGGDIRACIAGFSKPHFDATFMKQFPKLEIIASFGVGYDHINVQAAREKGVIVTNTPDVLTDEVADLAMGLLIATVRRLPQADRYLRDGAWVAHGAFGLSDTLQGKTMGIVGMGRIGKAIAKRARAFGVKIVYHGRTQQDMRFTYFANLVAMAQAVDILMVVTPGGASTHHLINAEVLKALGAKGTLINVARGSVVDEEALIVALQSGFIGAAGLDVFEVEPCAPKALIEMQNVVLLPHIASASQRTRNLMGKCVADNIISWLNGKEPKTPVFETPYLQRVK